MTADDEASFHHSLSNVKDHLLTNYAVLLTITEATNGELTLHIAGMKTLTVGYHDAGKSRSLPHATLTLAPVPP